MVRYTYGAGMGTYSHTLRGERELFLIDGKRGRCLYVQIHLRVGKYSTGWVSTPTSCVMSRCCCSSTKKGAGA